MRVAVSLVPQRRESGGTASFWDVHDSPWIQKEVDARGGPGVTLIIRRLRGGVMKVIKVREFIADIRSGVTDF